MTNIDKLAEIFPEVVTEAEDDGKIFSDDESSAKKISASPILEMRFFRYSTY